VKILKVIHGYPYRYNAGSEVYSQMLCQELARQGHDVIVFTRQENAYKLEYSIEWETDPTYPSIKICLINMAHGKDGYQHPKVDEAFKTLINEHQPDLVHIGHLNHLSTSLVAKAAEKNIPIVFTLHDFWLMCPRGQFLQGINSKTEDLYPACESQDNEKCARLCYWRYFSKQDDPEDIQYWTSWVGKRMKHVKEMSALVDLYIAPSRYLMDRFLSDFSIQSSKMVYLDYGFYRDRLQGRKRDKETDFVFGYIGTHKQAKGIFHLIQAFSQIGEKARLKIWGSPLQPFTQSLKAYVKTLGSDIENRIHWMGGYRNDIIVEDVFNHTDAIVVPSIWGENSPLVIHEALEAKVPLITADYGGMKEYVHHQVNGLLFKHRDPISLAKQMKRMMEDPILTAKISQGGYLQSEDRRIPCIKEHASEIISLYEGLLHRLLLNKDQRSLP
jgi:glycosyltransferase involved in cell wall biosynthesis